MSSIRSWTESFLVHPGLSADQARKRLLLGLAILVTVPALSAFAVSDLVGGRILEASLLAAMIAVLVTNLVVMRKLESLIPFYRVTTICAIVLLGFELATGGGEGYAFVWFYFFPIATFFIFGLREGTAWSLLSFTAAVSFLIANLGPHQYKYEVGLRFVVTYSITCIISYAIEMSRNRYYRALLDEKQALEDALKRIKVLSGLLPICASCKKIRDDAGSWKQVETYVSEHSEAGFTHGLCPDCVGIFFPGRDGGPPSGRKV